MPTYDYECQKCGHHFEAFHKVDHRLKECPKCKGAVKKKIGAGSGVIFKGSGFYETDYKKGGQGKSCECPNSKTCNKK